MIKKITMLSMLMVGLWMPAFAEITVEEFQNQFGYEIKIPNNEEYRSLSNDELIILNNVLKDLPSHFYHLSSLKGFMRRQHGMVSVDQPEVATVLHVEEGYIELTDKTFLFPLYSVEAEILRLLGVFVYRFMVSPEGMSEWDAIGQWKYDFKNQLWLHEEGNFTNTYDVLEKFRDLLGVHINTPEEDFSYSFSFYLTNPSFLKGQSQKKYAFMKEAYQGVEYEISAKKRYQFIINSPTPDLNPPHIDENSVMVIPHNNDGCTEVLEGRATIWDEETRVRSAYIGILSPDRRKQTGIQLQEKEARAFLGQWKLPLTMAPGKWIISFMYAMDQANNAVTKTLPNQIFEVLNKIENLDTMPPVIDIENIQIQVLPINARGEIIVKITVPARDDKMEFPHVHAALCVSEGGKTRSFQGGEINSDKTAFIFKFVFSIFDEPGPWYFSRVSMGDASGNISHINLPRDPKYSFRVASTDPDLDSPTIDVDGVSIEVIDKNKNGTGIQVRIRFSGGKEKSGINPTSGNVIYIRSPKGKRYTTQIQIDSIDPTTGEIKYKATFILPDHPDSEIDPKTQEPKPWLLEEIQLEDRASNRTRVNFLERKIKKEIPMP